MNRHIAFITIVVPDYDVAIEYYSRVLGFSLIENTYLDNGKRWVLIKPEGFGGCMLLLAKAVTPEQMSRVGNQTGGRVFIFLYTDDIWRDYKDFTSKGVLFLESPRIESYGTVVVFQDIFGNKWDLIEPKNK